MNTQTKDDKLAQNHAVDTYEALVEMGNNKLNAETDEEREEAIETIHNDALEAKTEKTYKITVTFGGPNIYLVGELNDHTNQPENARLELYWGNSHETISPKSQADADALLEYARQFYFEA